MVRGGARRKRTVFSVAVATVTASDSCSALLSQDNETDITICYERQEESPPLRNCKLPVSEKRVSRSLRILRRTPRAPINIIVVLFLSVLSSTLPVQSSPPLILLPSTIIIIVHPHHHQCIPSSVAAVDQRVATQKHSHTPESHSKIRFGATH